MGKYKVAVYAICKNEEKFVKRWYESVKEADGIFVLDTGSTDNTAEELKKLGANVTIKKIEPWRFDVARNESLNLVPEDYDICVRTGYHCSPFVHPFIGSEEYLGTIRIGLGYFNKQNELRAIADSLQTL